MVIVINKLFNYQQKTISGLITKNNVLPLILIPNLLKLYNSDKH